jgi:GT2 family glycosyltransferase
MISSNDSGNGGGCRASIVIASYNRRDDLAEGLRAIETEIGAREDIEVIVFDDASTDGTPEMLQSGFPWVRLVKSAENRGPSAARNAASRVARGALLLYLDSDGVAAPGWLDAMLAADDGETVLLGCAMDYDRERVQRLPRRATFLGKSLPCRPDRANTGPSCNLGVPRRCFDLLNGFDEELRHFEDSDLCIRAARAGFAFRYLPEAVFRHKGSDIPRGKAVEHKEHYSTYAMLKAYRTKPLHLAAFSLGNGLWLAVRLLYWPIQGRFFECRLLFRGWRTAYVRFWRGLDPDDVPGH